MGAINETLLPNGTINATLNYEPAPCNCSYVSFACFFATSGRVWEPPDRQFANLTVCDQALNGSANDVTGSSAAGGNSSNSKAGGDGSANGTGSDQGLRARRAKRSKDLWEVEGEVRREMPLGRERRR